MCGIAGYLNRDRNAPAGGGQLTSMMSALAHRGPDGDGAYLDGAVALGHKRLAIIDIERGNQPMTN